MHWSMTVGGHTEDGAGEVEIARKLGEVLAAVPGEIDSVSFSSSAYSGDPRQLVDQASAEQL